MNCLVYGLNYSTVYNVTDNRFIGKGLIERRCCDYGFIDNALFALSQCAFLFELELHDKYFFYEVNAS